ncbi:hypothetical protein [Mycobacteroides abscessus]|uniref:hypothetical protein n=1 Tax=Mycobacteroides abscessus TaxID=36809 RepID=UPI0009CA0C96|nr:hypothetical protein [Mycobacteroides abscessus]SLF06929.1 Uncharacterised protein [Mycobacteroides abscessus subsp. abscessus]
MTEHERGATVAPSARAMARAVQDQVLAEGHAAATVAVYGALTAALAELTGAPDASCSGFPDDAVLQAARREISEQTVAAMGGWIGGRWGAIVTAGAVLDALDGLNLEPVPPLPDGALAYRGTAEELALAAGESCAAVSWAGAQATARWLRLYGGRVLDSLAELAAGDPVLTAAGRELAEREKSRVTGWVIEVWEAIDERATEPAA